MSPVDRRRFLTGSLATLGAGGAGAAVALGGSGAARASAASPGPGDRVAARGPARADGPLPVRRRAPGRDPHPAPAAGDDDRAGLDRADTDASCSSALQQLSVRIRQLTQGTSVGVEEIDDPPPDSGILGAYDAPDSLTVTLAFGATLFDHRYGLASKKPAPPDRDAARSRSTARPEPDRRRPAGADLRRPARHGRPHGPRADARDGGHVHRRGGRWTGSRPPSATPIRTPAPATCSPSATAPPIPT